MSDSAVRDAASGLRAARALATSLLVVCATGMVVCRWFEHDHRLLAWPRAFFEAATIGALADWFAVVALFRHPLGLPIPHTAVLPKSKARVAESLAGFLEKNFLSEERLGPKFRGLDYAGFASQWLRENEAMLVARAVKFVPGVVHGLSDKEMTDLLAVRARHLIATIEVGPIAGEGLEVLMQNGRDREIFGAVLASARTLLEENHATIQAKIRKEIPISRDLLAALPIGKEVVGPMLDQLSDRIAAAVATKTIEKVQGVLDEAAKETGGPLWISFNHRLRALITDLKSSPTTAAKLRGMQETLADGEVVTDFAAKAWLEVKEFLLEDCASEDSTLRAKLAEAIRAAVRELEENPRARDGINTFVGEQVLAAILAARPHAREFVVATIEEWDSDEMAARLEETVGRDLQFVRLNGTLVGGLIGLALHAGFSALGR